MDNNEEFKPGEELEVRDNGLMDWIKRKFVVTHNGRHYFETIEGNPINGSYVLQNWVHCRRPKQSVEEWHNKWMKEKGLLPDPNYGVLVPLSMVCKYYEDRKKWEDGQ
jgi:hypothetical protein